ncbi:CvpA family protein [Aquabacterium fontiphilum]|uniref:CvpA family protein n=1 Tax=Aquabacterium fontiphilum TaxID=450365 RepID=UPI0013767EEB|nr:CvpA family protein [Aquabacterium fontiphilum]NBD21797.1 CvpA family protein [Aquabacterium fontiphilum]
MSTATLLPAGGSWLDWVLLGSLVFSVLVGAWRGLVTEVLALLGWVVAYLAARLFGDTVAAFLPIGEAGSMLNAVAGMVVAFVLAWVSWSALTWLVSRLVRASVLSAPDRVLGAGFGLLRGLVMALLVCVLVSMTPLARLDVWQASVGVAWLQAALVEMRPMLPPEVLPFLPT